MVETIGVGLQAIGHAVGACATAYALVYIVGIASKTFLIYTGKATNDSLKDWFRFKDKSGRL